MFDSFQGVVAVCAEYGTARGVLAGVLTSLIIGLPVVAQNAGILNGRVTGIAPTSQELLLILI